MKFQELRLQELAEDVPQGHIPRGLTAVVKGELVRHVTPGDVVELTGVFLPKPYTGFKARRGRHATMAASCPHAGGGC